MLGGIYTPEKCALCGLQMRDNGRNAVACPRHPKQKATVFIVRFTRKIWRKFITYEEASRFLNGLRFKKDEGTFDVRDYQPGNPMGFSNLADKWLDLKRNQIKHHSWDSLNNYMRAACNLWGNRNVKEITYGDIEDFLYIELQDKSDKTKSNAKSALRSFFNWLCLRRVLHRSQLPEFPAVSFELAYRKTISKQQQEAILAELWNLTATFNPRLWIAISWLSTYISIRPGELIRIKEREIDRENGFLVIPDPKEKRPKIIPLTEQDREMLRSVPVGFPDLPFFRHISTHSGCHAGQQFGTRYLWKWRKQACANLGIAGVDLYGGTRHSTVIYLGEFFTPEQLKKASFHSTNKAFERYYRMRPEEVLDVYSAAQHPTTPKQHGKSVKLLK